MHKKSGWVHLSGKWAGVFEGELISTAGSHSDKVHYAN